MKYDGPFEISPVTYQLHLPVSYGIHPILNIAHLEVYKSPVELGERPTKSLNRDDLGTKPEADVERILAERFRKIRGRRIQQFKVRWKGFGPGDDEWLTKKGLRNAPMILQDWLDAKKEKVHQQIRRVDLPEELSAAGE